MQEDSLGRVAGNLIGYVQLFRDAPEGYRLGASDLRAQLLGMLDQISGSSVARSIDPAELDAARFALAAWADESILTSPWSGHGAWQVDLLQTRLFGTNKAGDEFYVRLAGLPPHFSQAREVYFLCLVHGFEGRYAGDPGARQELIRQLYEQLRMAGLAHDASSKPRLSSAAYDLEIRGLSGGSGWGLLATILAWTLGTALGVGLLYLGLWMLAGGVAASPET